MQKTAVISARVPLDIANLIKTKCKSENISTSKYIQKMALQPPAKPSKVIRIQSQPVKALDLPEDIKSVLSIVGGVGVGTIVYKCLMTYLPDGYFETESDKEDVALIASVASGLVGLIAIDKLLEKR
jgi:hypothetical protein